MSLFSLINTDKMSIISSRKTDNRFCGFKFARTALKGGVKGQTAIQSAVLRGSQFYGRWQNMCCVCGTSAGLVKSI